MKRFYQLAKKSIGLWIDSYATTMGAAIAFYTVFSLAPLVMIVMAVAGFFWGREAVQGELLRQITDLLGQNGAQAVEGVMRSADEPAQGLAATVISLGILAIGATTVFAELQSALDRIWRVPDMAKRSGIVKLIRARLLSFGLVLGLAFLLMVSLVVSAVLAAFGQWTGGLLPGWEVVLQVVNVVVSFAFITFLFAMIFKFMPQVDVAWRDVWTGAVVTALLFEVGKFAIGLYVGRSTIASSYAAAGSLVVVLVWVYYAALVFLLGAAFTATYASEHGSHAGRREQGGVAGWPPRPVTHPEAGV